MLLEIVKKYFWIAKLVFVALLASQLAMLVNKRFEAKIGGAEIVDVGGVKVAKDKGYVSVSEFAPMLKKNIFNSSYVYVDGALKGAKFLAPEDFELIGTIAWNEEFSMAVIRARVANKNDVYRIGDEIEKGARIVKIEPKKVTIDRNGQTEVLELPEIRVASSRVSFAKNVEVGKDGIKEIGEGQFLVSQDLFRDAFSNPAKIMRGAAVVPFFEKGGIAGFRLKKVRKNSIYGKLGLQKGDVLRRINGIEIKGIDDIMQVMASMREAKRFSLDLARDGKRTSLSYEVR